MPRALNEQAQIIGRRFLLRTALNHERFLALGFGPSYPTLDWFASLTSMTHVPHVLGEFDGIAVIEFDPRIAMNAGHRRGVVLVCAPGHEYNAPQNAKQPGIDQAENILYS